VRRTISADTAATLTTIMEGVVERGTAKLAQMPGYSVAGKTGTAAKLLNGHYSTSDYNASFVGFVPSRNPAIAIIVVTDSPHGGPTTGGPVSGPVFKRIAEATLQYLGVGSTINPSSPVLVARDDGASSTHTSRADAGEPIVSLVADGPPGTVPDFSGLSAREAVRRIVKLGMNARVSGDGFVVSQDPAPGLPIEDDGVCRLVLERLPHHPSAAARP
jgi:membrane peptidoglycan carboxypeptidase